MRAGDSAADAVQLARPALHIRIATGVESRARGAVGAMRAARVDIAIVTVITLLAAVLRIWHLGTLPPGLHGDEAWTGLDARRVLHEGWIGPYVLSAVGQPTGPLYFTALLFTIMPETTFTLRFSMALFGIATVPLAYAAFASMFNRTVAAFASLLLTVMMWHLHLSRTGFMVIAWPLVEMAVLLALWHAMRLRSLALFVLAGALTGLGLYTYNAFYLFLPVPFVAMLWTYAPRSARPWRWRAVLHSGAFAVVAFAMSIPLLIYIKTDTHDYRFHQKLVSVTNSNRWKEADGVGEHAHLIWRRTVEWQDGLINGDRTDFGDGLATPGRPPLGRLMFVGSLVGLAVAVWNWRRPEYAVVLASLLLISLGALLTVGDGLFRRTLGLAPFVALLAALPLAWLWDGLLRLPGRARYGALLVLVMPAYVGAATAYQYFGPLRNNPSWRVVYPYQMDAASHYIGSLPTGTIVYFFSGLWSFDYETRRFIAPDALGVDRSIEFRYPSRAITGEPLDFGVKETGDVAIVLLAPYLEEIGGVEALYPGGTLTEETNGQDVLFRGYHVSRPK